MLNEADRINIDRELAKRSLSDFIRTAWPIVEPRAYVPNWHMDAICDHLQAVSRGDIRRIIINIPPRHTKSLLCNVFWPSWDWIDNAWRTFLFSSYRTSLSERDNKKARRLVGADWYQSRFQRPISPGNDAVWRWGITAGGERLVSSVGGASSTGEGGDIIVIDDPISADGARSELQRLRVIEWWDETIKSRLNDPEHGAFVVVMQRLHESDLSGHILAHETGWDHLCLPARYEPDHPTPVRSSIGFTDPRTEPGQLLNPKRFTAHSLSEIAAEGTYAAAGQLQQRPAPRGGGMFHRDWFVPVRAAPVCVRYVRGWDVAASTQRDSAYTVGVLMGQTREGDFVVIDVVRKQLSAHGVEALVKATAAQDFQAYGGKVMGSVPQDPGASGKVWAQAIIRAAAGYNYRKSPESGDKVSRAEPFSAQAEAGNVMIVLADWNKDYLDEIALFPNSKFKDQVDASSRSFMELTKPQAKALTGTQA